MDNVSNTFKPIFIDVIRDEISACRKVRALRATAHSQWNVC